MCSMLMWTSRVVGRVVVVVGVGVRRDVVGSVSLLARIGLTRVVVRMWCRDARRCTGASWLLAPVS